jgi:hypothetical protein
MATSLHLEDFSNFVTTLLYIYHSLPGMLGLVNTVLSVTRATSGVVRTRSISERRPALLADGRASVRERDHLSPELQPTQSVIVVHIIIIL